MNSENISFAPAENSRQRRRREAEEHNAARAGSPRLVSGELLEDFAKEINSDPVNATNMSTFWHVMAMRVNAYVLRGAA